MLRGLFTGQVDPATIIISIFCVLLCLTVHEVAHGFAAYKLGDMTAKNMGRLTLNPIPHIDPIGGLALLFFGFGWAKPVPVNANNFTRKISMRTGMAITALAGPLSNFIFAFISMFILFLLFRFNVISALNLNFLVAGTIQHTIVLLFQILISMNLGLAVFNLIPIPPLDGSHILASFLPNRALFQYQKIARFGFIILILAISFGPFGNFLGTIIYYIWTFFEWLIRLILFM
ncbi:MAG: site-2 protease family protein [Oscillospiraceae bacterium]|nr:site-2 protease family protein [Oscillospiraceae bacterium]